MLIHNGDMIAIILHGFVPPGEASKTSFATMERSSALALGSPRWCSLATGSVAVTSPSTGGYPKPSKPELCLFDRTLNLPFSHLVRSGRLSVARYRHSGKNARNQENWSPENLERCADIWAIEFVQANLRSHLASWLRELDSLFPEEFPFGTFRVERSCFSAMAVTENYPSTPHTDRDMSNSVIAWFLQGEATAGGGGQFAFATHRMFFRPRQGTVIMFRSAWLQHCTMPIRDRRRQFGVALYLRKETLARYVVRQSDLSRINEALNESMRTKNCTRRREKRKIGPLEGALRVTYCGSTLRICDETSSPCLPRRTNCLGVRSISSYVETSARYLSVHLCLPSRSDPLLLLPCQ
ncbi:unnamed protein product [Sphagnum tenellum]